MDNRECAYFTLPRRTLQPYGCEVCFLVYALVLGVLGSCRTGVCRITYTYFLISFCILFSFSYSYKSYSDPKQITGKGGRNQLDEVKCILKGRQDKEPGLIHFKLNSMTESSPPQLILLESPIRQTVMP